MNLNYKLLFIFCFYLTPSCFLFAQEEINVDMKEGFEPAKLKWLYVANDCEASLDRFIAHFSPLGPIKTLSKELKKEADEAIDFLCNDERMEVCHYDLCDTYQAKKDVFYLKKYNKILKKKINLENSLVEEARLEDKKRKLTWNEFSIEKISSSPSRGQSSKGVNSFSVGGSSHQFINQGSSEKEEYPSRANKVKKLPPKQAGIVKQMQKDKNQRLQERIKKLKEQNPKNIQ